MSAEGGNDQNNNCRRKRRGIMMRPVNYLQLGEMFILKQYPVKHYQNYKPFFPRQQADTHWVSEWVLGFFSLRGLLSKKLETVMVAENIHVLRIHEYIDWFAQEETNLYQTNHLCKLLSKRLETVMVAENIHVFRIHGYIHENAYEQTELWKSKHICSLCTT